MPLFPSILLVVGFLLLIYNAPRVWRKHKARKAARAAAALRALTDPSEPSA